MTRKNLALSAILTAALMLAAGLAAASGQQAQAPSATTPSHAAGNSGGNGRAKYVGDSGCVGCHQDQAASYLHTMHHLTSQPANKDTILGSFLDGSNVLTILDSATSKDESVLYFKMEAKDGGYYQTAVIGWPGILQSRSERMDVVIGTGTRGQSFLYWHDDQLFELPVSYWSDGKRWINSPGYPNGTVNFSRPVDARCMECHATFIQARTSDPTANTYDKASLIPGISCETCHGPGADHVALHQAKQPSGKPVDQAILNPAKFSRDRQVDVCALCHNALRQQEIAPAFSFLPGKPLDNYLLPDTGEVDAQPNVHGDQVGLLKKSRCYLSSPKMTCSTCHDVHAPERPAASYSTRCLSCHQVQSCGRFKTLGAKIADNCIDCHMPVQSTTAIVSETAGQLIRPRIRTHWIKPYQ